jgi:hypothetical protein
VLLVDFDEVVFKRRSVRKFKEDPISEEIILKFLRLGAGLRLLVILSLGVLLSLLMLTLRKELH